MKKIFTVLVISVLSISFIFAQGSSESSKSSKSDKPTITYTFRDDGRGENQLLWQWIQSAYDSWEMKDQVDLNIAPITASEGDYFTKIALQLSDESTCPDLVTEDTFQLPNDASAGYLTKLDSYLVNYADWQDGMYYESMKKAVTSADGSVYGVPYCTDTRGLWYNRELLTKAGVIKQGADWAPKSWADVMDACAKVQEKLPNVVPFWCNSGVATGEATSMQTYEMLLYGTGDRLINDEGKWIIDSAGMRKALQFIQDIYTKGYGPSLNFVLNGSASNTSAREYLPNDKLAISLDGIWIINNWKATGPAPVADYATKFGYAAMPTDSGQAPGSITLAGGWAFSIPEKSKNKDLTFAFIKHLMDPSNYLDSIIVQGAISTRNDIIDIKAYSDQPFFKTATEFLKTADFRPQNDKYSAVSTSIQSMVESVVTGTSIDKAISQYAKDVTRTVGTDNVVKL